MPAIFFALISYFGWGAGDILGTVATRKVGSYLTNFYIYLLVIILFSFYIPFSINELSKFSFNVLALNLFLGVIFTASTFLVLEALRIGSSSLIGTIAWSFSSLVVIFSLLFFGEKIDIQQIVSILIIFAGIFLSTIKLNGLKINLVKDRSIQLAFLALFLFGIYFTFIKIPSKEVGWFWPSYITDLVGLVLMLIWGWKKIIFSRKMLPSIGAIALSDLLVGTGNFSFNYAISIGKSSIVAPIAGSSLTLYVLLSFFIFKDKITKQQILGIIITLVGIVLLSFFSV